MTDSMDLRGVQSLFWKLITAPEGVVKGIRTLHAQGELDGEDLSFFVRSRAPLDAIAHLDVYADMYFYRLRDCLAEDFSRVKAWIGDDAFHNLVTDYLLAHPPSHFSLRELGRALPNFLATHALSNRLAAIADLARLEWARVDVFDEADTTPLTREDLRAPDAPTPESFAVALIPAARLLRVAGEVLPRWKQLGADGNAPDSGLAHGDDAPSRSNVRVWRRDFAVVHRSMPDDEAHCLRALDENPLSLAQLAERLLESPSSSRSAEPSAHRLAELLEVWTGDQLLVRAETG